VGSNQTPNEKGEPNPAYAGAILTAPVTPAALYAFYRKQLEARGFHSVDDYHLSTQVSGQAWEADQPSGSAVRPGHLFYEEVLVGYLNHPKGDAQRPT
jgi:hypothetical protein